MTTGTQRTEAPAAGVHDGRVRFDDFELDLDSGELWRRGRPVALRPHATCTLVALVRRAGQLVGRDELRRQLWPGAFVDWDQGLNQCVRQIRRVLGDQARSPRYVATVPRRGYRFVAPLVSAAGAPAAAAARAPGRRLAASGSSPRRAFLGGMATTLALLPLAIVLLLLFCAALAAL